MIITSDQIRKILNKKWPDLKFIWPTNPNWTPISDVWISRIVQNCSVRGFEFVEGIWECENYTHQWKANVERFQYELFKSGEYQPQWRWPVAKCLGFDSDIFMNMGTHSLNLLITERDAVLFEPQEDKILTDSAYQPFFMEF